ncbi:hypothetical protein [Helicobacter rodentium]|uniref:hypothetical protein n=1 Tax=Helicobacter rodentium TaxID=59617 RepID=UPI002356F476|nr:hypothetical protein [Helicobacter rodentium]
MRGEAEASVAKATDPHLQIHNAESRKDESQAIPHIESRTESHKDNDIIKKCEKQVEAIFLLEDSKRRIN